VGFADLERMWPGAQWSELGQRIADGYVQGGQAC
jgi:hypothetical protein